MSHPAERPTGGEDAVGGLADAATDPAFMSRLLALLYVAGSTLALLSMLLPQPAGGDKVGIYATIGAGYGLALVIFFLYRHAPRATPSLGLGAGTVLITFGAWFTGQATSPYPLFYVWVGLSAFYFLSRREAMGHVALAGACYALLLREQPAFDGPERWGVTMGTVVVAGLAMGYMRSRLEGLVARLGEAVHRLGDAARTDPLTGLLSRRGLVERLEVELERGGRSGRPLSLVSGDLDAFKAVNARLGQPTGDAALERVARIFERTCRRIDVCARTGGEEFSVLMPDTREREAFVLAERLRTALEREFADDPLPVTMSLGVASAPKDAHQADLLMSAADQALQAAKELGRNRTVLFSSEVLEVAGHSGPERSARAIEAQLAPLFKLAEALDVRDAGTAEHSQAVAQYAEMMARELGLDAQRVERIRWAGIVHDVGKIGVSDAILGKPGALTEEEWLEMRRHPEIGARLFGNDAPDIRKWVLTHHERPDGRGYPHRLQGSQIPLEARILAVADAFEAMTADRVYRKAMDRSEALAELERCSGSQFDPLVVGAFVRALDVVPAGGRSPARPPKVQRA